MRGWIVVAAAAVVAVVGWLASGASADPGARAAGGCQARYSVQVIGGGSWTLDPKGFWVDGNGSFCGLPQSIGATPADVDLAGVDDSTGGETTWTNGNTAAIVSFDDFSGAFEVLCALDGRAGYTCSVSGDQVTFRPSGTDSVAPRVRAQLLSRVPAEQVIARGRLGVLVRTSEPSSIRVSLVAARGGRSLGAGRTRARAGGERVFVPVRLTAAGRRALSRVRRLGRYRFVIRAVDRAGNSRRARVPVA